MRGDKARPLSSHQSLGALSKIGRLLSPRESAAMPVVDRRTAILMLLLAVTAVALNADRLLLGPSGPQRAHDLGDYSIANFMTCGQFWLFPGNGGWNSSILRGWPSAFADFPPQHLGCLVGAAMPASFIMPALQVVLLVLMTVGTLLFFRMFVGLSLEGSLGGVFMAVAFFYWFHEHDMVTSVTLVPALIGFIALRGGAAVRALKILALVLIIALSTPAATLVLMPLLHLGLCIVGGGKNRRRLLTSWAVFWVAYAFYYAPSLIGYAATLPRSNRSLFGSAGHVDTFAATVAEFLVNPNVLSPAFAVLVLTSRRTARKSIVSLGVIALLIVTAIANRYFIVESLGERWPRVLSLSTLYYRAYFAVPLVGVILGAFVIEAAIAEKPRRTLARSAGLLSILLLTVPVMRLLPQLQIDHRFAAYAFIVGAVAITFAAIAGKSFRIACVVLLLGLFPLRFFYSLLTESLSQGNLFVERPLSESPVRPFRVVSLTRTCGASDVFPAQAVVAGNETLDGISNYYSGAFAAAWDSLVAQPAGGCASGFRKWNTRVSAPLQGWTRHPDDMLGWLWVNNVALIRSAEPLLHPRLTLIATDSFYVRGSGETHRFLYALENPLGRVFSGTEASLAALSTGGPDVKAALLRHAAEQRLFKTVPLTGYSSSNLSFRGTFNASDAIVVSNNADPGWHLIVDGVNQDKRVTAGPLGMLHIAAVPGEHSYSLRYSGRSKLTLLAAMFLALLWLVLCFGLPGGVFKEPRILPTGADGF